MSNEFNYPEHMKKIKTGGKLFFYLFASLWVVTFLGTIKWFIDLIRDFESNYLEGEIFFQFIFFTVGLIGLLNIINKWNSLRITDEGIFIEVFFFVSWWDFIRWQDIIKIEKRFLNINHNFASVFLDQNTPSIIRWLNISLFDIRRPSFDILDEIEKFDVLFQLINEKISN